MKCLHCKWCNWILMYNVFIILSLYFDIICASNFSGIVENITVHVLEDASYLESDNLFKSLKLNISWMPPNGEKQPSSYSVMITNIPKETDIHRIECTESSAFYSIQNNSQLNLLVPQNQLLNSMSEVQILPSCTYKIQVYANPRAKLIGKLPEVIYTVPECIEQKCCMSAKTTLPIPKVAAILINKKININWNITSNDFFVHSYVISIGIPLLTSKAGNLVYNITKISKVSSTANSFLWDLKINDQYVKVKNGYKILIAATDYKGCLGTQGNFTITTIDDTEISQGNIIWLLPTGIVICVMLGFVSFISIRSKNKYQLIWSSRFSSEKQNKKTMPVLSSFKWPHLVCPKHNILYVEQSEETCCKIYENDQFEVEFKCIKLMCELGKGQFGKVYLGSLNNNESTLVAIKMSQCSDTSNEPEARQQLLEEIKTMKAAGSHPHVVNLIGYCTMPDEPICILLEYMEGGNLLTYLHSRKKIEPDKISLCNFNKSIARYVNIAENEETHKNLHTIITKQQFTKFALDIAKGMAHLETKGIIHRDLAARNILLASDLTLKVSDFGLSRNGIYVINNVTGKTRQLPIRWMSPEAICDRIFSSKSDVWSFAIVLWEIGTLGSFPYPNIQDDELLHYLTQDNCRLNCPDTISHDVYTIMRSCWNTTPQERPSFAQLVLDLQTLKEPLHSMYETSNPCYALLSR